MTALAIYQRVLDAVSATIVAGDFDRYITEIDLPYLVQTHLITEAEGLRATFETLSRGLAARGVTHYERVASDAEFMDCDRILGYHATHLIADGERITQPKMVRQSIVRRGQVWLFSDACYPIDAPHWPFDDATIFAPDAIALPTRDVA